MDKDSIEIHIGIAEKWVRDSMNGVDDARHKADLWASKKVWASHKERRWREIMDRRIDEVKERQNDVLNWKEELDKCEKENEN